MPLSGKDEELYTSKRFRQLMLSKGRVEDLMPHLIANGICIKNDNDLIDSKITTGEKIQELLYIVKHRIDSLEPFVEVLQKNPISYGEAIESLGFPTRKLEGHQSPTQVRTILNNVQFRTFMMENGDVRDLVAPLRAQNILTKQDQQLIESKIGDNQMIELFDILVTRLPSLDPLIKTMQRVPQTYAIALETISEEGVPIPPSPLHVNLHLSTNLTDISEHLKKCYQKHFSKFRPFPLYKRLFNISDIWINLQLENSSEGAESENYKEAILKALAENSLILLKGDPGMGKTMTQKKLAYDWAIGNLPEYDLVLCARFRDIEEDQGEIWDLVVEWMKKPKYLSQQHVEWLMSQQRNMCADPKMEDSEQVHVLCVLDGLDEARMDCGELQAMLRSDQIPFLSTAVALTSRPVALENVACPSPTLVFSKLNDRQVHDCTRKYLRALGVKDIEGEKKKLIAKVNQHQIGDLARIPLLLSCLCFIRDQISSDSVVDIYLTICQALVDRQQELKDTIKFTHKKLSDICVSCPSIRALSKMCLSALVGAQGFKPGTLIFTDQHLERFGVDKDLWLKVGLLNADREEGVGKDTIYELPHATFIEFFAAIALFEKLALAEYEFPLHLNYSTVESRLQTFTDWPEDKKQQPIDMPLAGFYYRGDADRVRCFYCGGGIINWEPTDIPLWEHALHFPSCPFLHQVKGQEFIDFVQRNKDSENVHQLAQTHGHLNVTGYNQIDQMHLQQSEPILKQVLDAVKPFSFKQMWTFVFEMAAQSEEGSNKAINNTVSFFLAWIEQRKIGYTGDEHFFQLFLRLLPKTREGLKEQLASRIRVWIVHHHHHSPSFLLSAASQAQFPMYKINDNAVYISDLDTVVLVKKHNCNTELMGGIERQWWLQFCLVEQSVLDSLPHTCMQMGWEKIWCLKIHVTEEPVEQQVTQVQTNQIKVVIIQFSFNLSSQSGIINLSPLFNRFTSINAETIKLQSNNPLIINDLPILFSNQQLKQQLEVIELSSIQFKDNESAGMFVEEVKNCRKLYYFELVYSKIGGPELLKLVDNLTYCPISLLHIVNEACLSDASIANQLIHLLTKFTKLEKLRLSGNNLSSGSIDRFCGEIKQMKTLKEIMLQDDDVKHEHLQSLREAGLQVIG